MNDPFFVTVDAETDVIAAGIDAISTLRDQAEDATGIQMPIVWFVRFQRGWSDSVRNESLDYFNGPLQGEFDGFALAREQLLRMQQRGDEVAWHYHAYNFVERDDLSHEKKTAILKADMLTCATELRRRYPEFAPRSLRFGWWFIPDYSVFEPLADRGVDIDASMNPNRNGNVRAFSARFLPPLSRVIKKIDQTWFFPYKKTLCLHDWNVVAHQFKWSEITESEARQRRIDVGAELNRIAKKMQRTDERCMTYRDYIQQRDVTAPPSGRLIEANSEQPAQ